MSGRTTLSSSVATAAKDEILSWIEIEQNCVTAQRIAQTFNMTLCDASLLLEQILGEHEELKIVRCMQIVDVNDSNDNHDDVTTTVFRLEKSSTFESPVDGTIFALGPGGKSETVSTAHERDMVQWREMLQDNRPALVEMEQVPIPPSIELQHAATEQNNKKPADNKTDGCEEAKPEPVVASSPSSSAFSKKKTSTKTTTTAASFFANHNKKPNKNVGRKKNSVPSKSSATLSPVQSSQSSKSDKEDDAHAPKSLSSSFSKFANKSSDAKVGNADDFVGDEEDDTDDEEEQIRREKRNKQSTKNNSSQDSKSTKQPKPPPSPVRGAMDDFTTEKPKSKDPSHQRKRRKRLVEKTTMQDGYLQTETQVIWEEIPTDEEDNTSPTFPSVPASRPKTTSTAAGSKKNQQQMKQKSLMGFFKKK